MTRAGSLKPTRPMIDGASAPEAVMTTIKTIDTQGPEIRYYRSFISYEAITGK